ncbi:hypothetical protein LJR039_007252 [Pseudorhodoferax sp. LjRoot39]|uniref:hypothetical protein n=1 Tax=Pseudorhodoferax sp. LjRoot39 TaxID=3342328 RepID=UPI003ED108B2
MLIAHCPTDTIQVSEDAASCTHDSIDTFFGDLPHGATAWVTCTQGLPHFDPDWGHQLFITLTLRGSDQHEVGDAKLITQGISQPAVRPGALFVVDPLVPHWLIDSDAAREGRRPERWIGLQWEVPRKNAKERARQIVAELGGRWCSPTDTRYSSWAGKPRGQTIISRKSP